MSRLLSVLSGCLCRHHALNVSERLMAVRFTQTQPVLARTQPVTRITDPSISLFHRPTKISIDSSDISDKAEQATIYCQYTGEAVDVCFNNSLKESLLDVQQKIREDTFYSESALTVESVDELMYKEIKPDYQYMTVLSLYAKLSKLRLTGLVVTTAVAGYALAPGAFSLPVLLLCSVGTGLMASSANALNQVFEVPYDSQMLRTQSRPLVKVLLSPLHAVSFAAVTGAGGLLTLAGGVNNVAAVLAMLNLLIYCAVYTPMKRISTVSTSLGAVVGAIPPMIGWASATGSLDIGAWLLAGVMYAWQFPHFNALSWNLRADYSRAGYRMASVVEPARCRRQAVYHSLLITALCVAMPYCHVTTWMFAVDSLPVNGYLTYLACRFYRDADSSSSRRLFRYSLVHLPALLVLMIISKNYSNKPDSHTNVTTVVSDCR